MKKLLTLIFISFSLLVYAEENKYQSPMTIYKNNFFISGNSTDQVKFQISAKYALLYPSSAGLFVGYTQLSKWNIYDKSSPFYDNNYMPEVFGQFESNNNFLDQDLGIIDYIQFSPIAHCSNGKDGDDSRSINTYYGQIQISYGDHYNIGTNLKVFGYYNKSVKNKDITKYKGYYESDVFFRIKSKTVEYLDKEELHLKFGANPFTNGWYCIEAQVRILTSKVQPKLFIQFYHGYSEFLIDYNKKTENALRAGLVF